MRRWIVRILIVIATAFGLLLVSGLVLKAVVAGSGKEQLVASLEQAAGVPISVRAAGFDLGAWMQLKPAVSLEAATIGNPRGFRSEHLLEAKSLSAQVSLASLLGKTLRIYSIEVKQPRILVESNAQGGTNIEAFIKNLSSGTAAKSAPPPKTSAGSAGGASLAVDKLAIDSGEIVWFASGESRNAEGLRIYDIGLHLFDFQGDRTCRLDASARLFQGDNSRLKLEGRAGPFTPDSLPLAGKLSVTLAPADIPAGFRKKQFGNLLVAPGSKSRASLDATVEGDVYRTISGPAKLVLSDLLIGKDSKHTLPVSGQAPIQFSAANLVGNPSFTLKMADAKLQMGHGVWMGSAELRTRGSVVAGSSRGKISSVDINELLSGLTSTNDKIEGIAEVPAYSLQFSGKDADAMLATLSGTGKISVAKGRTHALDLLATIQRALERSQETAGEKGSTLFTTLAADFQAGQSRLNLENITLDGAGLRVSGRGVLGFDQSMHFDLNAQVSGGVAQLFNRVATRNSQDTATIPLTVDGTVESPRVRPNVAKAATGVANGVAKGLLDSLFKKKQ